MTIEGSPQVEEPLALVLNRIAAALERIAEDHKRMVDEMVPPTPNIVGTPYVAGKLGCTTVWITEMIRSGTIPKRCIVIGTGNGKPWKFHREQIESWIASR